MMGIARLCVTMQTVKHRIVLFFEPALFEYSKSAIFLDLCKLVLQYDRKLGTTDNKVSGELNQTGVDNNVHSFIRSI